jgi:predicted HNH restriction endonuclease
MVALLKALAAGDVTSAKTDLTTLKKDLATEESALSVDVSKASSTNLTKDVTSLLKDLKSGDSVSAKSDLAQVKADLQAASTTDTSSSDTNNALSALIDKMSKSLSSGSVQGALQDLASYLVQNGQGTGSLVNTTA